VIDVVETDAAVKAVAARVLRRTQISARLLCWIEFDVAAQS
jgi:hypothetical protein